MKPKIIGHISFGKKNLNSLFYIENCEYQVLKKIALLFLFMIQQFCYSGQNKFFSIKLALFTLIILSTLQHIVFSNLRSIRRRRRNWIQNVVRVDCK